VVVAVVVAVVVVGQDSRDFGQLSIKALPVVLYQALYPLNSMSLSPAFYIAP